MKALRNIFLIIGASVGGFIFGSIVPSGLTFLYTKSFQIADGANAATNPFTIAALLAIGIALGAALGNLLFTLFSRFISNWDGMHSGDKANIIIGTAFGIIVSVPFIVLFADKAAPAVSIFSTFFLMLLVSTVAVFALRSMDDVLPWSKNRGRVRRSGIRILDANVIIDGRIYDIVAAGFLDGQLYVPKFVLEEVQYIADNADPIRRQRGKRGLDVLQQMKAKFTMEIGTFDRYALLQDDGVDGRLVRLARAIGADLVTNDYNLNIVAKVQEVRVININELALAMRPNLVPGEPLELNIIKEGSQAHQGLGYLEDGTMVVVEHGREYIGTTIMVEVTQVHQTERGKMLFAEVMSDEEKARVKAILHSSKPIRRNKA